MKWHYKTSTATPLSLRDSALAESWQNKRSGASVAQQVSLVIRKQQNKRQKVDSSVRVDCHALPYGKSRNDKEKNLPSHCEAKPKQSTESTNHIKGASNEAIYIAIHPDKIVEFLNDLLGSFHKDLVHYGEVKVGASAP